MKTVVGLMNSRNEALTAIDNLIDSGFQRDNINVMANENERQQFQMGEGEGSRLQMGEGEGSGLGAAGESSGRFGFLSSGSAPLRGLGVMDQDAEYYYEGVKRGGLLITVSCDDERAELAASIMRRCGAVDIDERAELWRREGWKSEARPEAAAGREGVIPVVEEEMQVGKRELQTGSVRVYSRISEVPVEEEIRLREEHAAIERRPVERMATEAERDMFKERSYEIKETAEEPVISKQARVKEEVTVGTEATERTEVIRDTLRRTDVEVERAEAGSRTDVGAMDDEEFERHFRATYSQRGDRFDESYRSAYRFAEAESTSHPEFSNKQWPEVEEYIHEDWERTHPGTWSKVQEAIHFGWDRRRKH